MKPLCPLILAVLLLGACAQCFSQITPYPELPDWMQYTTAWQYDKYGDGSHPSGAASQAKRPDPDSDAIQCFIEVHRLLEVKPGEDELNRSLFIKKAIFLLPLLRSGNGMQLAMRPENDLVLTLAKRLMLGGLRKGPRIEVEPGTSAIDMHVHTCYSPDSYADPTEVLLCAARRGLSAIAITDHNTLQGARKTAEAARRLISRGKLPESFRVIQGEEVSSKEGHIVGLFLTEQIPAHRTAAWTVDEIHRQGGIAIAAHPLLPKSLGDLANTLPFDAVETENAAETLHYEMTQGAERKRRAQFYETVTKPRLAVSDAHDPQTLGVRYTLFHCEATPEALRAALLAGDTTPVVVSDPGATHGVRRGLTRALAMYQTVTDMSPWLRRATHIDDIGFTLLPSPYLHFSTKF